MQQFDSRITEPIDRDWVVSVRLYLSRNASDFIFRAAPRLIWFIGGSLSTETKRFVHCFGRLNTGGPIHFTHDFIRQLFNCLFSNLANELTHTYLLVLYYIIILRQDCARSNCDQFHHLSRLCTNHLWILYQFIFNTIRFQFISFR